MNTIMIQRTIHYLAVIILILMVAGCDWSDSDGDGQFVETDTFSFEVAIQQQTRFRLTGINGRVEITGVAGLTSVRVFGDKSVRSDTRADAQRGLDDLDVRVTDSADQVYARTLQPTSSDGRTYTVDYTVEIPMTFDVEVAHVNGDVIVTRMSSDLDVDLVNGQVLADITMPTDGEVEVNVVNGTIELDIPASTSATLSCTITNGNIGTSGLTLAGVSSTSRSLQGTLGSGEGSIELAVVNGTIQIDGSNQG
ncbi:MAG: hypothetical protein HKN13_02820 [Rhodothermales bacterium]|nr:hypothetical protein [Rhodothermales bacterium]